MYYPLKTQDFPEWRRYPGVQWTASCQDLAYYSCIGACTYILRTSAWNSTKSLREHNTQYPEGRVGLRWMKHRWNGTKSPWTCPLGNLSSYHRMKKAEKGIWVTFNPKVRVWVSRVKGHHFITSRLISFRSSAHSCPIKAGVYHGGPCQRRPTSAHQSRCFQSFQAPCLDRRKNWAVLSFRVDLRFHSLSFLSGVDLKGNVSGGNSRGPRGTGCLFEFMEGRNGRGSA